MVLWAGPVFAVNIYRSVGPGNTSDLANHSGSNLLTISGSTATFSSAQPGNVGVGDVIQYDADNNGTVDHVAFITGRTDSSHYSVQSSSGAAPTSTTAANQHWGIFRAYTALNSVCGGTENTGINSAVSNFDTGNRNLTTDGNVWNIACYGDGIDATPVVWDNWTTDATDYIRIYTPYLPAEVGVSQRHTGKWTTTGAYALEVSNAAALTLHDDNMRIEGLQIAVDAVNGISQKGIDMYNFGGAVDIRISACIIRGAGNAAQDWHLGISEYNTITGVISIWNNIIYNFTGTSTNTAAMELKGHPTLYLYNNTVVNCYHGYWRNGDTTVTGLLINNIAQNCTQGFDTAAYFDPASDYNVSDLNDAPGANSQNGTVAFVNAPAANYHLAAWDTVAQNAGTDLSGDAHLAFTVDINGEVRTDPWDIGADEQTKPAGSATATPTATPTVTFTPTISPTLTYSPTATLTATISVTLTHSATTSPTPTRTPTSTPSPFATPTATVTPTLTVTPTVTVTSTFTAALVPADANVYPNPYRSKTKFNPEVHFVNLQAKAIIRLYDLSGQLVKTLTKDDASNLLAWNLQNEKGSPVASGIYLFIIETGGQTRKGKLALLR